MISRCGITAFSQIQPPPLQKLIKEKMSKDPSYFLVPATSGLCIQPKDGRIYTADLDGDSKQQQWIIEQGKDRTIAFRNLKSGEYLRLTVGKIATGEKQFWGIESSNTPNAFRLRLETQYLCNM